MAHWVSCAMVLSGALRLTPTSAIVCAIAASHSICIDNVRNPLREEAARPASRDVSEKTGQPYGPMRASIIFCVATHRFKAKILGKRRIHRGGIAVGRRLTTSAIPRENIARRQRLPENSLVAQLVPRCVSRNVGAGVDLNGRPPSFSASHSKCRQINPFVIFGWS